MLYFQYRENKSAENGVADPRLCFRIYKKQIFNDAVKIKDYHTLVPMR